MRGRRALGGQVGEIHAQRLAGDAVSGIKGKEIHAFGNGVSGHHQIMARTLRQNRGVILQSEGARARQGCEILGDDTKLVHGVRLKQRAQ